MKFLVRNIETKKSITQPTTSIEANKICKQLNQMKGESLFEVVPLSQVFSELSTEKRAMSADELEAISRLKDVKYNPKTTHADIAASLMKQAASKKKEINEKQSVYLWHIVYHYRKQIGDENLIEIAKGRKVY